MTNRKVCVRNLPRNVPDYQIRDFFNSLTSGQVENILRTAGYVLITFLSPEAAKTVMEMSGSLEVRGARVHLSWWLDREVYSSQPRPAPAKTGGRSVKQTVRQPPSGQPPVGRPSVGQPPMSKPPMAGVQQGEMMGPVEKLQEVSLSQGWGVPQYSCSSYLDNSNQELSQYSVMVPAFPNTSISGEASHDRQLAMMNCACAALQGIVREIEKKFSSENSLTSLQEPHLQSAAVNTWATATTASVLSSQEVPGLDQRQRRGANKARKGGAAPKKLQARQH